MSKIDILDAREQVLVLLLVAGDLAKLVKVHLTTTPAKISCSTAFRSSARNDKFPGSLASINGPVVAGI